MDRRGRTRRAGADEIGPLVAGAAAIVVVFVLLTAFVMLLAGLQQF
jgi:hypothetical protein